MFTTLGRDVDSSELQIRPDAELKTNKDFPS